MKHRTPSDRLLVVLFCVSAAIGPPARAAAQPAPGSLPPPVNPTCITSPFGPRGRVGPHATGFHKGLDFRAPAGTWVHAVAPGRVLQIRRLGAAGLEVDVLHEPQGNEPQGNELQGTGAFVTRYAHLGTVTPALANGRRQVGAGEALGRVGWTGVTYGTHLYFELRLNGVAVDPEPFFAVSRCQARPPSR
jgi:murein DD-endopeptidase MepM/ murein hydrolase activator NlpD